MNTNHSQKPKRDISLDGIRLVATLLVILIHISGKGFTSMVNHWWAINIYESLSRVSVPLFFMLTGVLLLPKEHTVSSILNRIVRVTIPLIAWSLLYLTWSKYIWSSDRENWFLLIINGPVSGHLWYLYTLIGAYLFMPVMATFYRSSNVQMQIFLLTIWFIAASILPTINNLVGRGFIGINWSFFYIYPAYLLGGAVMHFRVRIIWHLSVITSAIWLGCIAAIAFLTWFLSVGQPTMNERFYEYYSPFVFLGTFAAFLSLKSVFSKIKNQNGFLYHLIQSFSHVSFGVYLIHPMVIWVFDMYGYDYKFINPWLSIPLLLAAVTSVSTLIVWLLQKIPFLRMIVPG